MPVPKTLKSKTQSLLKAAKSEKDIAFILKQLQKAQKKISSGKKSKKVKKSSKTKTDRKPRKSKSPSNSEEKDEQKPVRRRRINISTHQRLPVKDKDPLKKYEIPVKGKSVLIYMEHAVTVYTKPELEQIIYNAGGKISRSLNPNTNYYIRDVPVRPDSHEHHRIKECVKEHGLKVVSTKDFLLEHCGMSIAQYNKDLNKYGAPPSPLADLKWDSLINQDDGARVNYPRYTLLRFDSRDSVESR